LNRNVTAVVAGRSVAEIRPGTLTRGSAKSGRRGDADVGCELSTARACRPILTRVLGGSVLEPCSTTSAGLSASDDPNSSCSVVCARDAAVLLGTSCTNPNPESEPKSGRNAVAATVTAIQSAMIGNPRWAVTPAYSRHGQGTVERSSLSTTIPGEEGGGVAGRQGEAGGGVDGRLDMRHPSEAQCDSHPIT
jgi:hypothetical protein